MITATKKEHQLSQSFLKWRSDFPVLEQKVNGKPLIYLDNAATTQKPQQVIQKLVEYYQQYNANIHRGIHALAEKATHEYEAVRNKIASFINAQSPNEIIFVRGVTEAVNLVANTWGKKNVKEGDEIIISTMEHHSNIVPWQMLCEEKGATLKIIPINEDGEILWHEFENLLSEKTKLISIVHASNALGTVNPIEQIIKKAHHLGAKVFVDGAQSTSHLEIDVQQLNVDFFAFSGHKLYGPTGIGCLFGKEELLNEMPPFHGGGEMIKEVTFEKTTYNELPYKFEAGTPNIADTIALGVAVDYISNIGKAEIAHHENELLHFATSKLNQIDGLKMIGKAKNKISIASFVIEGIHHQDLAILLDKQGIAVRTGHHCTQPLMKRFGILGTTRASFALYNTFEEVETFEFALKKAVNLLR
ncbi:MAG: cysteine desulfurase [Cytophagales bacterium]